MNRDYSTFPAAVTPARPRPAATRGRSLRSIRRAHVAPGWGVDPVLRRDEFLTRWSRLMIASFADAAACADWAGVTVVCARNWMDGDHRPCGDVVDLAWRTLPRCAVIMGEGL